MKKILFIFFANLFGCISTQQQIIDSQQEELRNYSLFQLNVDPEEFQRVTNSDQYDHVSILENDNLEIYPELMQRNFQSVFAISGYGEILGGELIRKDGRQSLEHFKIIDDYLLFGISYGGMEESQYVEYDLIWNGKYCQTEKGLTVDLVFSFKDLDVHKALVHERVGFDITGIRSNDTHELNINFLGYNRLITYRY